MDVIIHGKPLDASERSSSSVNKDLVRKIIDEFFATGSMKDSEVLVVDARYWNGVWHSVYTLFLSQNVKDTAGRGSYFAISLILSGRYCCLISEVYYLLEDVIRKNVLGVYLNRNLQYIVPDFENSSAFDTLCANLKSSYHNIEKNYDNSFKPQANLNNDAYCNVYDCDSLAILNVLKSQGRIIVSENTETKDVIASQASKYQQLAQQAQGEIQTKTTQIIELKSRISQMEDAAKLANSSASGKVKKLEQKIVSLETDNRQLESRKKDIENELSKLKENISKAYLLLEPKHPVGHKSADKESANKISKRGRINIIPYIPLMNTMLLLLISLGLLINYSSCESGTSIQVQVDSLNSVISAKNDEIKIINKHKDELETDLAKCKKILNDLNVGTSFRQQTNSISPEPIMNRRKNDIKPRQPDDKEPTAPMTENKLKENN